MTPASKETKPTVIRSRPPVFLGVQITAVNASASTITFGAFSTASGGGSPGLQCRVQQQSDPSNANVDSTAGYSACTSPQVSPPELHLLAVKLNFPSSVALCRAISSNIIVFVRVLSWRPL